LLNRFGSTRLNAGPSYRESLIRFSPRGLGKKQVLWNVLGMPIQVLPCMS
jgi:hypothetical protein